MNVKLVIFDWDGTLIDSVDHIADSLHQAATELGFPALEPADYRDIIGLGIVEALEQLYPGIQPDDIQRMREGYARYFWAAECVCRYGRGRGGPAQWRACLFGGYR
ncbi:MAG: phosphoglycolate phosphatase [Marinobacter sp. T13-3]|nr:MAG: phosphoglycolate phosphatase [Marinobacter sp. T13-3]